MPKLIESFLTITNSVLSPGFLGVMAGLAVVAAVFAPMLLTIALMAAVFGGVTALVAGTVKAIKNRLQINKFAGSSEKEQQQMKRQQKEQKVRSDKKEQEREVNRDIVYDRVRGRWNISALPLNMKPTVDSYGEFNLKGRQKLFDIGDIRGVVQGKAGINGLALFSFHVGDEKSAIKLSEIIAQSDDPRLRTASIKHSPDGKGYECSCGNPEGISLLFKKAEFASVEAEVKTRLHSVNQYEIRGCKTAQEAREKLEQMKASDRLGELKLVNSYEYTEKIMGEEKLGTHWNGKEYEAKQMEVGTFIINDMYVSTTIHKALVAGGEMMDKNQLASSVLSDPKALTETTDAIIEASIDGICFDKERFVTLSNGKNLALDKLDKFEAKTLDDFSRDDNRHYLKFKVNSPEEMKAVLEQGFFPAGREMTLTAVGKGSMREEPGVICIPVDGYMLSSLMPKISDGDAKRLSEYVDSGIEFGTLKTAIIGQQIKDNGSCTVTSSDEYNLGRARIMGISGRELQERLSDPNAYEFRTFEHMKQWAQEAAKIEDVDIKLDYSKSQLTIKSTVSNGISSSSRIETRTLSKEEMESVAKRLPVSDVQGKDLLMQCHPDYFKTYQDTNGRGMFVDPIKDFISGRKPETPLQRMNRQKQENKLLGNSLSAGNKNAAKAAQAAKNAPKPKR